MDNGHLEEDTGEYKVGGGYIKVVQEGGGYKGGG